MISRTPSAAKFTTKVCSVGSVVLLKIVKDASCEPTDVGSTVTSIVIDSPVPRVIPVKIKWGKLKSEPGGFCPLNRLI